jgi:proline dehydrogenase
MLFREVMLRAAGLPAVENAVRHGRAARGVVERFVAGETLEAAIAAVRRLNADGARASLNLLGEDVASAEAAAGAADEYVRQLEAIAAARLDANISVKLTQLGLAFDRSLAERHLERIVRRAAELDTFVRIDMESSAYTQVTLDLFNRVFERHQNVGVVVQAYLYRSPADVESLIRRGARVRLCKGAYREPPTVAYPNKADVDRGYADLMVRLLERGRFPGLATHDRRLIEFAIHTVEARGIGRDRFEFQMLYGVRRDLQAEVRRRGYGLRVYVPYGAEWYPYLSRRLAERPSNLLFLVSSVLREARA